MGDCNCGCSKQDATVTRGDQYWLQVKVLSDDETLNIDNVSEVEITIADLIKNATKTSMGFEGELVYDDENKLFLFPLTQEESFWLPKRAEVQARIKYQDNSVVASDISILEVDKSLSKEAL